MNIKEAIDRGLYPTDEKGRALVPMACGSTATILATDKPGRRCIIGWTSTPARIQSIEFSWQEDGATGAHPSENLLPPPPRKVKVTRNAEVRLRDQAVLGYCKGAGLMPKPGETVIVELTGEYEEPWS